MEIALSKPESSRSFPVTLPVSRETYVSSGGTSTLGTVAIGGCTEMPHTQRAAPILYLFQGVVLGAVLAECPNRPSQPFQCWAGFQVRPESGPGRHA